MDVHYTYGVFNCSTAGFQLGPVNEQITACSLSTNYTHKTAMSPAEVRPWSAEDAGREALGK